MSITERILYTIALAAASGVLNRMGGAAGWDTKWRDAGVPLCSVAFFTMWYGWSWFLIAVIPLQWASLSSYRYWMPKPKDYGFKHYALHGFFCGCAALPVAVYTGHWWLWLARAVVIGLLVGAWSRFASKDIVEEFGRGVIILL
jgi:hypothetical protein